MDYKVMMRKELNRKWKYLRTFGEDEDDDEDEEVRLTALCNEILHEASEVGDLEKIIVLIEQIQHEIRIEIDLDMVDESGQTSVLIASGEGYPDIVEYLIQNEADVNIASHSRDTPLIQVSQNSIMNKDTQLNIVEQLIHASAIVNCQGEYGKTPLMLATESNSPKIVSKLLESGTDVSIRDQDGNTALDIAQLCEIADIVEIITDYINKQNEPKTTATKGVALKK